MLVAEKVPETQKPPSGPAEASVQLIGENAPVTPVAVKLTVPVGVELPGPLVSVTKTRQNTGWLVATEVGMHPTRVEVVRVPNTVTVMLTVVGFVVAPSGEPVTWRLYAPGATVDATLSVKSLVVPNWEGNTGLKVKDPHVIPDGREELTHDNETS